ncbi:F-type conjugal transfer pilus assembly protein TraB [Escherichia coli]|uniref:F-type conjugal transfer pilus assembly protein TraB n=1 Tax=Escherichia coli TaxID=562 RepID=UPI0027E4B620|nr:F-type conjugal transfer pilus assembly protein TraB [Escherichia coli]WMO69751.1 F-type conjugal transfer pilus assembly protein TraB [Escherichia coli]
MASINTIVKRKQYLWLGIVVVGTASAIGGALYLSDVDMSGNGETVAEQEPVPDMTGVVDTTFDDKVRQHATTEMQVTAAQMQKQYANASVTGNESTVPMQLRITGLVEMPNSKTYDATGCFVGLEAWGDVSSERAIVRTRNISCLKDGKTIDMPIKGHVSFRGKNGIKGEVVMRNGKILGWAWGAGFVDGIGQGMERASQPAVGLGATAAYGAGDVLKMGIGGGASKAAQTLSDYYIKRAEQYHPVIPIGAGNEVTVVFQDGFQLKTVEEMALERTQNRAEEDNPESPVPVPPSAESHLNGFNTDQMLKQLGNLNPQQFMSGSQGGGNDGK